MKTKKVVQRILYGTFTLLGFTACGEISDEYGSPITDYQVKGRVTSEDGKPLQGIQVIVKNEENAYHVYQKDDGSMIEGNDTVYTNADGQFVSHQSSIGWVTSEQAVFHDIDGDANGGFFKSDSVKLADMESRQIKKGDGHWYEGMYEYTTEIKLAKEKEQHKN